MSNEELEMKLLKGSVITIEDIKIKPLLIEDIIDNPNIGYDRYLELIGVMGADKSTLQDISPEQLEEIKTFDIFIFNQDLMKLLLDFLKLFLQCPNISYAEEHQIIIIDYDVNQAYIHRDNYDKIIDIFRKIYCIHISKESKYNPANEQARALIEKIRQRDIELARLKHKNEINLFSIISGVAWKSPNLNIFDVFKLTVFQLYDAYYRLEIIDNCKYTMTGMYAGTIDSKNIKQDELTWVKKYNPFS